MSPSTECREVTRNDAAKLVPLFEAFYGQWFGESVTPQAIERRIRQARGIENVIVAERDGGLVGFASLRLVPSLDITPYAELSELFVAKPFRRQGVARRLLEFVERRARERGAIRLVLTTDLKNAEAQGFYRAVGFADHALFMDKPFEEGAHRARREIRAPCRAVLWRRDDAAGTESFLLSGDDSGWSLEGTVVAPLDRKPAHVRYRIACDSLWRTAGAEVVVTHGGVRRELRMSVRDRGTWWVDGTEEPSLRGCTDVDLEISPSTNTLPIRRLNLPIGQEASLVAAWVRFPGLTVEALHQTYARTAANRYRYASGDFAADIEVDDLGLVIRYKGGWSREAEFQSEPLNP